MTCQTSQSPRSTTSPTLNFRGRMRMGETFFFPLQRLFLLVVHDLLRRSFQVRLDLRIGVLLPGPPLGVPLRLRRFLRIFRLQ